ncbi:TBC1 domain family member 22B isoform X1 [Poecilia latipinna]|uniref:TBC1 domain family member 22B isoform X1 n=1 Tax=Poecilia formosa TaxID=48698 RepID=UPI000443F0FB|nr:PREDICTED: TBC1 domain family member 22B isoform X1 [Poecilia formosa]XP_014829129.1 PREDICTED: TBC1 domain family member 22B isoform X1 [Poecilia mexicana]XP_014901515.1 PREDICTED: TBC1 domain family member 22B-like isoform X1 [Poecilia latipinna]
MATDNRINFWRRNTKVPGSVQPVYGAQHPPLDPRLRRTYPKDTKPKFNNLKSKKACSFHEFACSTNDAWDIDDEEDDNFCGTPFSASFTPSGQDLTSVHNQQLRHQTGETEPVLPHILTPPRDEGHNSQRDDGSECERVNGKFVKSSSDADLNTTSVRSSLQKQQSLPVRPIIPLVARISDQNASGAPPMTVREKSRLDKFKQLLASPNTDLEELRKHSWSGIPREVRPITWRLLSGYLPANKERRELVLKRKREEYFGFIEQYYHSRTDEHYKDTYRQIHIDIPRTNPLIPLFQQPAVQEVFERILFIWAIRHPASGYVQGINDLVTPFFVVFLSEFVTEDVENFDVAALPLETQRNIEADSFWCMSKLLDGIQDNYTFAQPGIQNKVKALEELVSRIDVDIHNHFKKYEVEYLQFAFRWMNNLLMRELPLRCTIRLWDTYQAEAEGFSHFHLYVCAAFLIEWRKEILCMVDFQSLLMLLQNLPTIHWGNEEVGLLLAEAYRLKYMFADAPNHYKR